MSVLKSQMPFGNYLTSDATIQMKEYADPGESQMPFGNYLTSDCS